jgi:hypothetical protein
MPIVKYQTDFVIREKGETTGEVFTGKFVVKTRLSHRDRLNMDVLRRQLLGPIPQGSMPSERALNSSEIFSQLSVRIVEAPSWWTSADNGIGLDDDSVVSAVYQKAVQAEADALKEVIGEGEQGKTEVTKAAAEVAKQE